jgi:hypothetical protein
MSPKPTSRWVGALIVIGALSALGPVWYLLWQALRNLTGVGASLNDWSMGTALVIISSGLSLAAVCLLLRLRQDPYGMTRPPSLAPALVIVALGVVLGAASVFAASGQ